MIQIPGRKVIQTLAALAALVAVPAIAHPGLHHVTDFSTGFVHPLGGWDHLLAMFAVGLWASQQRRAMTLALPLAFPLVMIVGAMAAAAGFALPAAESGIAASVLVLGLLVAFAVNMPAWGGLPVVALFAAAHGFAHGLEMPAGGDLVRYGAGFVAATVLLHLAGLLAGRFLKDASAGAMVRALGGAVAAGGLLLFAPI